VARTTPILRSPRAAAREDAKRTGLALLVAVVAALAVAIEHGFGVEHRAPWLMPVLQLTASWAALVMAGEVRPLVVGRGRWRSIPGRVAESGLLLAGIADALGVSFGIEIAAVIVALSLAFRLNAQLARTIPNPSVLFPASFVILIAVSTALLKLPAATPPDRPIGWIDALFTATSAVCVTGLVVRDTATGFTPFGQTVIGASIQLGGLGIMIFGSTLALLFGARLSFRENLTLSSALSEYPAHRIARFVGFIVLTTLTIVLIGAVANFVMWPGGSEMPLARRAGMAAFHSVSAFCNAGFDLTGESLVPMRSGPLPYLGAMPLIILGGLGFLVLDDLRGWASATRAPGMRRPRLTTHTRLVLITTATLLVAGAAVIFVAQLKTPGTGLGQRLLDAAFMSTTARTAGFNTVPMDELQPGSRFMIMILMTIGGSPGSTAGGVKTVVIAVLAIGVYSTIRGRDEVELFGRSLPDALVKKAAAVAFAFLSLIAVVTLTLDLTERIPFEPLFFEVISAASTTGLSLGVTDQISPAGRCVLAATMFAGRVGLLALLASLIVGGGPAGAYRFPRDSVSLG
jgi:trk system potassium uptake protein TrkH